MVATHSLSLSLTFFFSSFLVLLVLLVVVLVVCVLSCAFGVQQGVGDALATVRGLEEAVFEGPGGDHDRILHHPNQLENQATHVRRRCRRRCNTHSPSTLAFVRLRVA